MTVVHKRRAGEGGLCRSRLAADGGGLEFLDVAEPTSDYWDKVTCLACLALKPADAAERTSFKHSHRAEGGPNFID